MSNLKDWLNSLGVAEDDINESIGGFIGVLADFSGAWSVISGLPFLSIFTNFLQPKDTAIVNAISNLENTITQGLNQVETQIAAQSLLDKLRAVDNFFDPAHAVFLSLPDIIPDLPNETVVDESIQTCLGAVAALRDNDPLWTVPWSAPVEYSDSWSGDLFPPHSDFVFSYTYTLPKFLHAIGIFIAVVAALKPSDLNNHIKDLTGCIAKIQQVNNFVLTNGIVGTRVPSPDQVVSISYSGELEEYGTLWLDSEMTWPYGAVEQYSGANNVESYSSFLPYRILPGFIQPTFFNLLNLRIENKKKVLYTNLGFPPVRQTIINLQKICQQPISTDLPYETWSLRNALSLLGITLNLNGVFFSLITFFNKTPPYSGGQLYPARGDFFYPPAPIPRSFRSIFLPPVV